MVFQQVDPDDSAAVEELADVLNRCAAVDDPGQPEQLPALLAGQLRYGWDLEPGQSFLYRETPQSAPVGTFNVHVPLRDNLHLVETSVQVLPEERRQGHGSAMIAEAFRRTRELGRTTIWAGCWADDEVSAAFLKEHGFSYASHDARRLQWPAELDQAQLDRQYDQAAAKAADYELVRVTAPSDESLLSELVEVTAAINDAPMGELDWEPELFDLQRLKDFEYASQQKGERLYRVFARHRQTGAIGGHTVMMVQPTLPSFAEQYDTAVHRDHRGHRLGMLLKLEMMRWLAETEPQLRRIETWNNADNRFMIDANEAIGYRLSRIYDTYQRTV